MDQERTYYIVNKHGLIFECSKEHFVNRVKNEVGFRAPSASELKEYLMRQEQGRKRKAKSAHAKPFMQSYRSPIAEPFTTDPDEAMAKLEQEMTSIEKHLPEVVNATDGAIEVAEEFGVNISEVEGSGAKGKIVKADVMAYVEGEPDDEPLVDEPEDEELED